MAYATPEPTIYDAALLRNAATWATPALAVQQQEAARLQAQIARQQQAEAEFNQIMLAQRLRNQAAAENDARQAKARMAEQEAEMLFRRQEGLANRESQETTALRNQDAQERRAKQAADEYFKRISEKEKQDLLSTYALRGFVPKKDEEIPDFIVRVAKEEEEKGTERILKLRGAKDQLESEYYGLASELENERNTAAQGAAISAVKSMGGLKPAQVQMLNQVGYNAFIQSLYKTDPEKAAELDSVFTTARDEALKVVKGSPAKLTKLQLLGRNIEDVDVNLRDTIKANPRFDVSTFYNPKATPVELSPQTSTKPVVPDISAFTSGLNKQFEKTKPEESAVPTEVTALTQQFREKIGRMPIGQQNAARGEAFYESIGEKFGFPKPARPDKWIASQKEAENETRYLYYGDSTLRKPYWKAVKSFMEDHPYLINEIEQDPEAVREIYESAIQKASQVSPSGRGLLY